jgi:hypothetical protein
LQPLPPLGTPIDRSFSTTISQSPALPLMVRLAAEGVTGTLILHSARHRSTVHLERGRVVRLAEDPPRKDLLLGRILVRSGTLTEEGSETVVARARESGKRFGEVLRRSNLVSPKDLEAALYRQLHGRFLAAVQYAEGLASFKLATDQSGVSFVGGIDAIPALFRYRLERWGALDPHELDTFEQPRRYCHLVLNKRLGVEGYELQLNQVEQVVWERVVAQELQLVEVYRTSPINQSLTACILFALEDLGILRFEEREREDPFVAEVRILYTRKAQAIEEQTLFEVLDAPWTSSQSEILRAQELAAQKYDHKLIERGLPKDLAHLSEKILAKVAAAASELMEPRRRRAYRLDVVDAGELGSHAAAEVDAGDLEVFGGHASAAVPHYRAALELTPDDELLRGKLEKALKAAGLT